MSLPNRHHYLPVFYLTKWTGEDGRLVRYHRPYDKALVSRLTPEHTGFEDGLYSLAGVSAQSRQMIETDFFSPVDNDAAPVMERLITQGASKLDNEQRSFWTRFVMSLELRSPQSVAEVKSIADRNLRRAFERLDGEMYLATKKEGDPDSPYDYALQQAPERLANTHKAFLPGLIDHEVIGQHIINMHWEVMDLAGAAHTLLTADRPYTSSHGLGNPACLLAVPLSPTRLFVAANDVAQFRRLAAQKLTDTVRNMNTLMVKLAIQNVYGCTDDHLAFVEKRLRRASDPWVPGIITRD